MPKFDGPTHCVGFSCDSNIIASVGTQNNNSIIDLSHVKHGEKLGIIKIDNINYPDSEILDFAWNPKHMCLAYAVCEERHGITNGNIHIWGNVNTIKDNDYRLLLNNKDNINNNKDRERERDRRDREKEKEKEREQRKKINLTK